jgi:diguanylate cyclase (GGDEF)-like protein
MWDLLAGAGLAPHGFCLSWQPGLIWLHLVSDLAIGFAYFSIPLALVALVRRRQDLVFSGMLWLFAAFIVACGATHFMSVVTLWIPAYWAEGWVKAVTAILSVSTALLLWPLLPKVAALPSPTALQQIIDKLQATEAELIEANQRLGEMARIDSLTGIANRLRFDEVLNAELKRCERSHLPLSLILIDIDMFKSYNDQFGHPAGDTCLQRIAQSIALSACRPGDLAARYGGEEFAVILPETPLPSAMSLAERIRVAIHDLDIAHPANPTGGVTVSLGVATLDPPGRTDMPRPFVERADSQLYEAKRRGRDRVMADPAATRPAPPAPDRHP